MNWSLTIGRIAGTDIRLHVTFLMFIAWIGIADILAGGPSAAAGAIAFTLLVVLSAAPSDVAGIPVARRFGAPAPQLILSPIGNSTEIRCPASNTAGDVMVGCKTPSPRTGRADATARMRSRAPPPKLWRTQRGA